MQQLSYDKILKQTHKFTFLQNEVFVDFTNIVFTQGKHICLSVKLKHYFKQFNAYAWKYDLLQNGGNMNKYRSIGR